MTTNNEILLKNGRIIDPVNGIDQVGDLLIKAGRISAVGPKLKLTKKADRQIFDCKNKWILPGLIDMHVHLREPGEEYKETVQSGTMAAAAGGFTAVACMPNTSPVNDNQSVTKLILEKAKDGFARVYPVGAISKGSSGESLAEFGEMQQAGAVAVSDDGRPVNDSQLMRRALEYASNYDLLVISHSEDPDLSRNGVMNEGLMSTRLGLRGIPRAAEEIMVYRDIALARQTGRPLHLAHISTGESVDMIRRAKKNGVRVTAETAPHYFSLTEEAVGDYDTHAKMNPPLRIEEDRLAIIEGLKDGTLDAIATDHAPHSSLEKEVEFDVAANGIIGLETAVPLTLAMMQDHGFEVKRMVEFLSVNPARILGVPGGSLSVDLPADITVIDPKKTFLYSRETVVSKSANSPFLGRRLKGKAVLTIMGGRITFSEL